MTTGTTDSRRAPATPAGKGGFSLVELVIALIILTFGLLGMAGTTALVVRQTTLADVNTERAAALQTAVERVRSMPYTSQAAGNMTVGHFTIAWTVSDSTTYKAVRLITTGPGLRKDTAAVVPTLGASVQDTFNMIVLRP